MKKTGYFFATFLPMLLSISLQFVAVFFLMGCTALVQLTAGKAHVFARIQMMVGDINYIMMLSVLFAILNIAVFGFWYYYRFEGDFTPDVRKTFHPALFGGLFLMAPVAQLGASFIVNGISRLLPGALERYTKLMETAGLEDSQNMLTLLYAVILGPIGEELIFRGVTLRSARRVFPFWGANLMQAILFGVFHMNLIQGVYAFALGLILGLICQRLGSIYYSIFLHICFNLMGTVGASLLNGVGENNPLLLLFYPFLLAALVGSILLIRYGKRQLAMRQTDEFFRK